MADDDLRDALRALPAFPAELPVLDPAAAPADPMILFRHWLSDAVATGSRQPHAFDLVTVRPDGAPVARILIIKAVDERGIHFSTHGSSRKGVQLAANPVASMLFFWRESGRTVRITGPVVALPDDEAARDWQARPSFTGQPNPDWRLFALQPTEFEFMQAREDRRHVRLEYLAGSAGWAHGLVESPAG